MTDSRLTKYETMWTTDRHRYALIQFDAGQYLVMNLETGGLLALDDDDEVVAAIISNMHRAGVRIVTPEEARPK